jgi:glucosyl-dolichyl phosphate glucuronosyltransferase
MRFSICICTFNRADLLRHCLGSLMALSVPEGCMYELVVVDNNSTDHTKQQVENVAKDAAIAVRYVFEPVQGISVARNTAVDNAQGEYLCFLDDECIVRADWLLVADSVIRDSGADIIGGPYTGAFLPGSRPVWYKQEYGDAYFVRRGIERGFSRTFFASGGNMFVRRSVFDIERFDPRLGMEGTTLKLGEEVAFQRRYLASRPEAGVFYEPALEVAHFVLPHKMSLRYHATRMAEVGASRQEPSLARLTLSLGRAAVMSIVAPFAIVVRDRKVYPFWQNYVYENVIPMIMPPVGILIEAVRGRYR